MRTIRQTTSGARRLTARAFLLLALALLPTAAARAQWTTPDANGHVRNNNDGYVGVGTGAAAPPAPLTVRSDANVMPLLVRGLNSNAVSFGVLNDQPASKGWAFQVAGSNNLGGVPVGSFIIRQASNDFNTFVVSPMGNVGVGAVTPASQFHVHNGAGFGAMRVSGGGAAVLNFQDTNAGANSKLYQLRSEGGVFRLALVNDAESGFVRQNVLVATAGGFVGIGKPAPGFPLDVGGAINASGNITADGDISAAGSINAKYQDVAEWVPSTQRLAAGTVVVLDASKTNHVLAATVAYDTRVAGVVSAQPGVILGERGAGKLMVATTGRVRVKVDATNGPVRVGDLLVTSGVEGVAMKSVPLDFGGTPLHRPGTIIGKALEPLEKGVAEILVLLSLQ